MYIDTVVSYKKSWRLFSTNFPIEYQELSNSIDSSTWYSLIEVVNIASGKDASEILESFNYKKENGFSNSLNEFNWAEEVSQGISVFKKK